MCELASRCELVSSVCSPVGRLVSENAGFDGADVRGRGRDG